MKKVFVVLGIFSLTFCFTSFVKSNEIKSSTMDKINSHVFLNKTIKQYCQGKRNVNVKTKDDSIKIDCLTDNYAFSFDYAENWDGAVGKSLYYGLISDKKPAIALILESPNDKDFVQIVKNLPPEIHVVEIKKYKE